jgi:diguanylate cyclase (GGDEF)-like protein/PAS domain S-box-containing protein
VPADEDDDRPSSSEVVHILRQAPHRDLLTGPVGAFGHVRRVLRVRPREAPRSANARTRLRIWHKLAAIGLAFLFPVVIITSLLVVESGERARVAQDELRGLDYLRSAGALLFDLCAHERLSRQVLARERPQDELRASVSRIDGDLADLQAVDARVARHLRTATAKLNTTATVSSLAQTWHDWASIQPGGVQFMISQVRALIGYVGLTSSLVIDPEGGTYHVADALVRQVPDLIDGLTQLAASMDQMFADGAVDRARAASMVAVLVQDAEALQNDLETASGDWTDRAAWSADARDGLQRSTRRAVTTLQLVTMWDFVQRSDLPRDRAAYARLVAAAVDATVQLWAVMHQQERRLLDSRRAEDTRRSLTTLGSVLATLAVTALLTGWLARRIATDVGVVARAASGLACGDLTRRARVRSRDEVGALAGAFNEMAGQLERSQRVLRAERDFVGAVLDVASSLVLVLDRDGRVVRFNRACEATTGYRFADVDGATFWDVFLAPEEIDSARRAFLDMLAGDFPHSFENSWITRDGSVRQIAWSIGALHGDGGEVSHVIATGIDVTERRVAGLELREAQERFRKAFVNASIGMCLVSVEGRFIQVNPAFCAMLGHPAGGLVGRVFAEVTHPDDLSGNLLAVRQMLAGELATYRTEKRYLHAGGYVIWGRVASSLVYDENGDPLYFVTQIEDVTARRAAEEQLIHQAMHDSLTGLPNRMLFMDRLRRTLSEQERSILTAVLFIDLDGFKAINDSLGHGVGDQVLQEIAGRLEGCLRPSDTVARLGGDEFVVLCPDLPGPASAGEIAQRLALAVDMPISVGGHTTTVTASIGVAVASGPLADPEKLVRDADSAMYHAKTRGQIWCEVFLDPL